MSAKPAERISLCIKTIVVFVNLLCVVPLAHSQSAETSLSPGQTIEREMTGAEAHRYKVSLKAGHLFQVRVEQKGVDVASKLIDTAGNTVASMDSPNGREGSEILTYVADKGAKFILEVVGFDPKAQNGAYTLKREDNRSATEADERRVAVEKLFVEGMDARNDDKRTDVAIAKLQQALNGWQMLGDQYLAQLTSDEVRTLKQDRANALFRKAIDLIIEGSVASLRSALSLLTESNRLYEEIGEVSSKSGKAQMAYGSVCQKLGEIADALGAYEKALDLFRKSHETDWEATTLSNIGLIYIGRGEIGKALENLNRALELRRSAKDRHGEALAINNIAGVLQLCR